MTIISLEQTIIQRNEETFSSQMTEINTKHEMEINNIRDVFENEKKRLSL